jgi:hypothetical protein
MGGLVNRSQPHAGLRLLWSTAPSPYPTPSENRVTPSLASFSMDMSYDGGSAGTSQCRMSIPQEDRSIRPPPMNQRELLRTHRLCPISESRIDIAMAESTPGFEDFAEVSPLLYDFAAFTARMVCQPDPVHRYSPWMHLHADSILETHVAERVSPSDVIEGFPTYSTWFGLEKDDAFFRLLADLTALNKCMTKPPNMKLPTVHEIIIQLLRHNWMGQLDARSFFFQFGLGRAIRNFFIAKLGKGAAAILIRALVLLMGWNHSPAIGQRFSNGLCSWAKLDGCTTVPWLDNFLGGAQTEAECRAQLDEVWNKGRNLGLEWKDEAVTVSQEVVALGLNFNLSTHCVKMSDTFVQSATVKIDELLATPSPRKLFTALGSAIWQNHTVGRSPLARYPDLLALARLAGFRIHYKELKWDDAIYLSDAVVTQLQEIRGVIIQNDGIMLCDLIVDGRILTMWTDASSVAYGFVAEFEGADVLMRYGPFGIHSSSHIFVKELLAAVWSLEASAQILNDCKITWVHLLCDNKAVVGALRRGHGVNRETDLLIMRYYEALKLLKAKGVPSWVSTLIQRADAITRNSTSPGPKVPLDQLPLMDDHIPKFLR